MYFISNIRNITNTHVFHIFFCNKYWKGHFHHNVSQALVLRWLSFSYFQYTSSQHYHNFTFNFLPHYFQLHPCFLQDFLKNAYKRCAGDYWLFQCIIVIFQCHHHLISICSFLHLSAFLCLEACYQSM